MFTNSYLIEEIANARLTEAIQQAEHQRLVRLARAANPRKKHAVVRHIADFSKNLWSIVVRALTSGAVGSAR